MKTTVEDRFHSAVKRLFRQTATKACLANDSRCSESIIKAHSIQNSAVLERVMDSGHVYMFSAEGFDEIKLAKVGRNLASVFTGFCALHDHEIFAKIDLPNLEASHFTSEQHLLFALRALSRELWAKLNAKSIHSKIASAANDPDRAALQKLLNLPEEHIEPFRASAPILLTYLSGTDIAITEMQRWFASLSSQVNTGKYHLTDTHTFKLPPTRNLAVSSYFTPEFDFKDGIVSRFETADVVSVTLTILPLLSHTEVIFSFHRRMRNRLAGFFSQLDSFTNEEQCVAISNLVVNHCENVAFSPTFVESMSDESRTQLNDLFRSTLHAPLQYSKMPSMNFFR